MGICTASVCHRFLPTGNLWLSHCFTDAAQVPAHRWWVAGMEGGSKPPSSPSWQSPCQEVHRQNLVLPSLLANKLRQFLGWSPASSLVGRPVSPVLGLVARPSWQSPCQAHLPGNQHARKSIDRTEFCHPCWLMRFATHFV